MEKHIFALIAALLAVLIAFSLMITAQAQELTIEERSRRAASVLVKNWEKNREKAFDPRKWGRA